jgi:predicted TIM-barrel fold metal-dependent hydrolase
VIIVDSHIHLDSLGRLYTPGHSLEEYIRLMDLLSIDVALCTDHRSLFEGMAAGMGYLRQVHVRSEGRVCYLGVFNPNRAAKDLKAIERSATDPGFRGIKIHPAFHGVPAEAPAYRDIWRLASALGLPILAHSWSVSTQRPAHALSLPSRFEGYLGEFPSVPLILAHTGGRGEGRGELLSLMGKHDNLYTDYAGDIFDLGLLESLLATLSPDRVLFGSDFPWLDPRANLGRTFLSSLPPKVMEKILGGNAVRLYRLEKVL